VSRELRKDNRTKRSVGMFFYLLSLIALLVLVSSLSQAANWETVVGGETRAVVSHSAPAVNLRGSFDVEPLKLSEMMSPDDILVREPGERCQWYTDKLGRFVDDCNTIARQEKIPPRLLATVILNELADIDMTDVVQDGQLSETHGDFESFLGAQGMMLRLKSIGYQSFGIAQISPRTALKYDAVFVPPSLRSRLTRKNELDFYVAYRLLDRRVSIRAAALIVKGILKEIEERQEASSWVRQFIRSGAHFTVNKPYAALLPAGRVPTPTMQLEREKSLAQMVVSIYNSGDIINAGRVPDSGTDRPERYPNAHKHGANARGIAEDLAVEKGCVDKLESMPEPGGEPENGIIAWVNLFGKDDKSGRIHVGSISQFKQPKKYVNELFAGMRTTHLHKKRLFPGEIFSSTAEAKKFLCQKITGKRMVFSHGRGRFPHGKLGGRDYYIDGLGCEIPKP